MTPDAYEEPLFSIVYKLDKIQKVCKNLKMMFEPNHLNQADHCRYALIC